MLTPFPMLGMTCGQGSVTGVEEVEGVIRGTGGVDEESEGGTEEEA